MSETVTESVSSRRGAIRLVVGLGNPGRDYEETRHNIGFRVVDELARRWGMRFTKRQARALVAESTSWEERPLLAKPQTFMNLSGEAVAGLRRAHGLRPEEILVVYDDIDLPFGRIRIRESGSAGGHGGVRSIIERLGTQSFPRLRVGVGRPTEDAVTHVLGRFRREEAEELPRIISRAADAIECALAEGIPAAMNRYNPG